MELIPGLPNDLGLQCLTKVPYKLHPKIRAACKSWNGLLSCTHFYKQRQLNGAWEGGVVSLHNKLGAAREYDVIIYYPVGHFWEKLPQIPHKFGLENGLTRYHRSVYVKSKQQLVVLGLLNTPKNSTASVVIFDFLSRRWRLGADMPCKIYDFACAASPSEGLLYVAGGYRWPDNDNIHTYLLEAFVYNVEENKWDVLPPMNYDPLLDRCSALFRDGKFYVVPHQQSQRAQVYDPCTGLWSNINSDCNAQYVHRCVNILQDKMCHLEVDWMRGWIDVKEIDFSDNSPARVGEGHRVASGVVAWRGMFILNVISFTQGFVFHDLFQPRKRITWYRRMPMDWDTDRFIFSSPFVHICYTMGLAQNRKTRLKNSRKLLPNYQSTSFFNIKNFQSNMFLSLNLLKQVH